MRVNDAVAWNNVLTGLQSDATEAQQREAAASAAYLTRRARSVIGAGPFPEQGEQVMRDALTAVWLADHDEGGIRVVMPPPPVETAEPRGGVL